ncbi:MAG: T9SS type A sorting domain-containing protein [Bacteroidetes bacterium]|nr:T9SS type A sorting domain-containing protein [Bacteroidota bacterium]
MSLNTTQLSISKWVKSALILMCLALPFSLLAQVTPGEGAVECFAVGEGGVFVDFGGLGGNDDVEGAPGNYLNCDCVTTTTLCGIDGSAVTLEFTSFGVFASFDWVAILDGDNPMDETYPHSVLTDPDNANLQLFNNADGVGDGGSENYGPGAENGITDLAGMPTTTFSATNPTGCLTVVFRASAVVDDSGWEANISLSSQEPHPGDNANCDLINVACPPPSNVQVIDVLATFATVTWTASDSTDTYEVEFGPEGFDVGDGTSVSVSANDLQLSGLEENTCYDVYVTSICPDGETSPPVGPITFCTPFINPPTMCTYTVEMFDSFGDGWNGSFLDIDVNGTITTFTLDNINDDGEYAIYTFDVLDGLPVVINYTAGAFQNEVTYNIYDSDNIIIFSDGPNPQTGLVYEEDAVCPDCPSVNPSTVSILDIGTNTVDLIWNGTSEAVGYTIEYGPAGFPPGFGLTTSVADPFVQITGLNPCVEYDFYITADCGPDVGTSAQIGPFTAMTETDAMGDPCEYTLNLFDSFGDGWNGSFLTVTVNGVSTDYTFNSGDFATFTVTAFANSLVTVEYTAGAFQNEVTYDILDPDNNVIFSDGPFPATGQVYQFIACPTCAGPLNLQLLDVNADNALIGWDAAQDAGEYIVEYGPLGFTLGTGSVIMGSNITSATLTGLLENTYYDVYVRFGCDDGETAKTLGPITFKTLFLVDVGVSGLISPEPGACNLDAETITFLIQNYGQLPQSLVPYFFAINGVEQPVNFPADGLFTGVVSNDSTEVVSFDLPYDFSAPGYYLIEIWTELEDDSDLSNDTFAFELITAFPLPLVEGFEDGVFPEGWTTDEFNPVFAPNAHNNPTWVAADNNWAGDGNFEIVTSRYGPLGDSDSLSFDYRYVNWSAGTTAATINGDMLEVQISEDCGDTFETIFIVDQNNHVPSVDLATFSVDLSAYAGSAINVRFLNTWATGDYWIDIDNINISGCPNTLLVDGSITDSADPQTADGSITAVPGLGVGPYEYVWSDGQTEATATGLLPGEYSVTVTDVNGCIDEATFTVGAMVGAEELELVQSVRLSPNPSPGLVLIDATLRTSEDVYIEIFNINGQLIHAQQEPAIENLQAQVDLSDYPDGMYFVRLRSGDKMHVEKLILSDSRP